MSRCGLRKLLFSSNVQLLCVITQSTGHTFLPRLPIGKKLGSNVTFMFSKKLCAKFNTTHRVIFLLTFPLFLVSIACFGTCSDLSQPPAFWWLTVQAGGREYTTILFLFKGYRFLCSFLFKKKARTPSAYSKRVFLVLLVLLIYREQRRECRNNRERIQGHRRKADRSGRHNYQFRTYRVQYRERH